MPRIRLHIRNRRRNTLIGIRIQVRLIFMIRPVRTLLLCLFNFLLCSLLRVKQPLLVIGVRSQLIRKILLYSRPTVLTFICDLYKLHSLRELCNTFFDGCLCLGNGVDAKSILRTFELLQNRFSVLEPLLIALAFENVTVALCTFNGRLYRRRILFNKLLFEIVKPSQSRKISDSIPKP